MLVYMEIIGDENERSTFRQIYDRYHRLMFYIADSILHNKQDAEDVVQEAFLSIAQNISKISEPESMRTKSFVATITANRAINLYNRRNRAKMVNIDGCSADEPGVSVQPPEENELACCILRLPIKYRNMIILKYSQGYSTRECAEILGISPSAASRLDQRAKNKLELMLREEAVI